MNGVAVEVLVASSRTSENFKLSLKTPAAYMVPEHAMPTDEIGAAYSSLNYLRASAFPTARERRIPQSPGSIRLERQKDQDCDENRFTGTAFVSSDD